MIFNALPRYAKDMLLGGIVTSASLFAANSVFQAAKTIGFTAYLISERGQLFTFSPLGPLMIISIIAKMNFDQLKFLFPDDSITNNVTVLTVAFLSTCALQTAMEKGNQAAKYVLISLTIIQLGLGVFCGLYLSVQGINGLCKQLSNTNPLSII